MFLTNANVPGATVLIKTVPLDLPAFQTIVVALQTMTALLLVPSVRNVTKLRSTPSLALKISSLVNALAAYKTLTVQAPLLSAISEEENVLDA